MYRPGHLKYFTPITVRTLDRLKVSDTQVRSSLEIGSLISETTLIVLRGIKSITIPVMTRKYIKFMIHP